MIISYLTLKLIKHGGRILLLPLGAILLLVPAPMQAQVTKPSYNQNFIQTTTPRVTGYNPADSSYTLVDVMQEVQYVDGLGRPMQTVQVGASPLGHDLVQPHTYDLYGREAQKYLSYTDTLGPGSFKINAITSQLSFYYPPGSGASGTQQSGNGIVVNPNPYGTTGFEPSPLNRIVEQGAPGTAWQVSGPGDSGSSDHTVRTVYAVNDQTSTFDATPGSSNMGSHIVALYKATINSDHTRTLAWNGTATYKPGTLYLTINRDENWNPTTDGCVGTTEEYQDMDGHVVLKRTYNLQNGLIQMLSTYYVYDDLGNLAFVLPPAIQADSAIPTAAQQAAFCYQYGYDERNRLIQKKIPGKGLEYIVYNRIDQPVMTQDAVQRQNNKWTITKYDAMGRVIMTGLWKDTAVSSLSPATLQANVYAATQWDVPDTTNNATAYPTGYVITSYPAIDTVLKVNYYDNYNNIPGQSSSPYIAPSGHSTMTTGLLTATKTAVLNKPADMLLSVRYYDDLARTIKTYQQHYLGGAVNINNYDAVTDRYDFTNAITATTRQHFTSVNLSTPSVTIVDSFVYDHIGRKRQTIESINGVTATLLSQNDYNEIGQLTAKKLHSENEGASFLQSVSYNYNERGWLLAALTSGNTFNFILNYNLPDPGISKQYNGNIAEMLYSKTGVGNVIFQYTYDRLNRLNNAVSTGNALNETISYDLNGNVMTLTRTGSNAATLNYSYYNSNHSNQLQSVTNNGAAFRNYSYDPNGNATNDGGGKIIGYNLLNLPQTITQGGTSLATYTYDATGNKLRNTGSDGSWDYINGIVYQNGAISFIQNDEGRASLQGSAYHYEYNLKDHLGNVRYSFDKDPTSGAARRIQEDEYYSFGLRKTPVIYDFSNNNRYLYNGKEIQTDLTSQYDFGTRFYDPVIARWNVIDPESEKYSRWSPYNYVLNNPVRNIDPQGDTVKLDPNSSKQFQQDYAKARALLHDKGQDDEVTQLENSTAIYTVSETEDTNGTFTPNKDKDGNYIQGGKITWNPTLAIREKNGTSMSPTTVLNHEFDHAASDDKDPAALQLRGGIPDPQYQNAEEKRVITGSEQRTALALGEIQPGQVTRTDHGFGTMLLTLDPTSNKGTPTMIKATLKPIIIIGKKTKKVNPKTDQ